jgi:hypothetical protein
MSLKNCVVLMLASLYSTRKEQFAVDAAGRGGYSREEGTVMVSCKVTVTVFGCYIGDLFPSPKIERTVRVLMVNGGGPRCDLGRQHFPEIH